MESTRSIRTYTSDAIVENLPPEVRHELLTILDLSSLRNMVHASPVYYRQYVLERRSVLSLCLERTLGRTVLDAYWVYRTSRSSKFPSITNDETISNFRQAYMRQQASSSYSILRKSITENLAVGMAAFHYSTIDPILQLYIPHVLEALAEGTGGIVDQESLSQVEQARLIRGLYRFQLCCNLFTMANFPESSTLNRNGRKMRILTDYISLLEPWEIEEMGCIYSFANERFERVFEAVWRCTTRDGTGIRPRKVPDPGDGYDLGDTAIRTTLLKSTISQGLPILHTILTSDNEYLTVLIGSSVVWFGGSFLEDAILSKAAQKRRHRDDAASRGDNQKGRDHMPFLGDNELYPPLAWTMLWNESYSKLYGDYIPDEIRRWGYVLWDAVRLERVGAKRLLERQWKETWADHDPRDDMLD
ncbi:hypothetical protein CDV36_013981 [Fusarium kuroshium]|uniref:Uncharacterized protein n=1 Tax=Fusarium kuroshium TaxID=2010991 RepID=A0A3M2RMB5_9HYPO|nr:hypothetical protein CDV36_013981 [Fusarium kuroshium]